jgi:undecaprenyl-diphosphatase
MFDHIASRLEGGHLKGLAFMSTFGMLWFQRSKTLARQRETLVLLLLAVVLSIVVARALADLLPFRTRPMNAPGIGFRAPLFPRESTLVDWSSFPSDTVAVVFVMTTGFWLLSRWWGLLWACFSVMAATVRTCFGVHYPGDVVAGALIGIGVMIAVNNESMYARIASPIVAMEQRAPAIFYGLLFPLLYEVSTLFAFTVRIRQDILHFFLGSGS